MAADSSRALATLRPKNTLPKWVQVSLPKIITAQELCGMQIFKDDDEENVAFVGLPLPSSKSNTPSLAMSEMLRNINATKLNYEDDMLERAYILINESDWGNYLFIGEKRIERQLRYFVGGKMADGGQITKLLEDFQCLIAMGCGYGFPSVLSFWYWRNEREWGTRKIDGKEKAIVPDALLDKIFTILSVYRLSYDVLSKHPGFDRTIVIGMLSLLEPIIFSKKSLADNDKFQKQLERVNFYVECFYKAAVLNRRVRGCPPDFFSLISVVMHYMDNLNLSSVPYTILKSAPTDYVELLDRLNIPFRTMDQIKVINACIYKARALHTSFTKGGKDIAGTKTEQDISHLNALCEELKQHRWALNDGTKFASLLIYDWIIKHTAQDEQEVPVGKTQAGSGPGSSSVIELGHDKYKAAKSEVPGDTVPAEDVANPGSKERLEGDFNSLSNSSAIDYMDPNFLKKLLEFIRSMQDTDSLQQFNRIPISVSQVINPKLNLKRGLDDQNLLAISKQAGTEAVPMNPQIIDLKLFYDKNRKEIEKMKRYLGILCTKYVFSSDKEGDINNARLMRLLIDSMNGDDSESFRRNRKEDVFGHITIIRDVSGSTHHIQESITNACLAFALAADLTKGIFVRIIDFNAGGELRKDFTNFVDDRMIINADGGTTLKSALDIMEQDPGVMLGTSLHLVVLMSDFILSDGESTELYDTITKISKYSKHCVLLNLAFQTRDIRASKLFTDRVIKCGLRNVNADCVLPERGIEQIISELVSSRLTSIIRERV